MLAVTLVTGCALGGGDDTMESTVVGGQPESGYPPVGYLHNKIYDTQYKTWCGVTLIAPHVVVTASHCVDGIDATNLTVGFGEYGSSPTVQVAAVHKHPNYVYRSEGDYLPWDDVAVLELAQDVMITPATIARVETGVCTDRYVGYGRNVPGDYTITAGYDGQRKSARICADAENPHEIYIHGADGGLCWGDSGGPLLVDGTTRVLGVLSRHAPRAGSQYSCENGNRMIFTALATYKDFIAQWAPNAFEPAATTDKAIGWGNVQWPDTLAGKAFTTTDAVYGRVWVDSVTRGQGQGGGILAEVGFGPASSAPDAAPGWIWYAAHYNVDADGLNPGDLANDEYMGTVFPYAAGTYSLAYRFSVDAGATWKTYASSSKLTVTP